MPSQLNYLGASRTQLRRLIPAEQEKALWTFKDELDILSRDPMKLHETAFLKYLKALGEQLYDRGLVPEDMIEDHLRALTADWKQAARRRHGV